MDGNKRSRELDLALFHLNTAIHEKLGDDYVNMCHTFDRLETEEIIETMSEGIRRAYHGCVMEQLIKENDDLDRSLRNLKAERNRLEREKNRLEEKENTYKERLDALEKENKKLLRMQDVLQKRLDKRVRNSRDDIDIEEIKYLRENGMSVAEIAKRYNTNRQTIYNRLNKPSADNGLYG